MENRISENQKHLRGHRLLTSLTLLLQFIILNISIYPNALYHYDIPTIAYRFMLGWLIAAIFFCILSFRRFVPGFLLSLFCMMIAWRIAGMYDMNLITIPYTFAFLFFLANFLFCATLNLTNPNLYLHVITLSGWQLIFIRLYLGLDFIPHFTEKLFAGPLPHMHDVQAFIHLGVLHPDLFVWLAGLCEFISALCIATGFLLRLGAFFAVVYLLIATYLGHHFTLGFIWASPGDGWEFAIMWAVLIFSFVVTGIHDFSLDQYIEEKFKLPNLMKKCL